VNSVWHVFVREIPCPHSNRGVSEKEREIVNALARRPFIC